MKLRRLADRSTVFLAHQVMIPDHQLDQVRFGLEIIIGSLVKGVLLFSAAWGLSIVPEVAIALVTGSLFRLLAGEAHCSTYTRCLLLGLSVYLGVGWGAAHGSDLVSPNLLWGSLAVGFSVACLVIYRWVPGRVLGVELTEAKRKAFKRLSFLLLPLWLGATTSLVTHNHTSLALSSLLALAAQALSVTPLGYRLIGGYDRLFAIDHGKGVKVHVQAS